MNKELANTVVMPLATPEEAKTQWDQYQALKASVLSESDFQKIGKGKFTKKSGFRKIATFFGLTDKIIEKERTEFENGFTWMFTVEAIAPNGRSSQGVGICDSRERKFSHVEHDVYATAHTRAKNRAISDLVAGGEVSAEEMAQNTDAFNPPATRDEIRKEVESASIAKVKADLTEAGFDLERCFKIWRDGPGKMVLIKIEVGLNNSQNAVFKKVMDKYGGVWKKNEGTWVIDQ